MSRGTVPKTRKPGNRGLDSCRASTQRGKSHEHQRHGTALHRSAQGDQHRGALVVTYRTKGITPKARVILPQALHTTNAGADCLYSWDSLRNTKITLRVDRIAGWHVLPVAGVAA
jgi:predicted DNA-binding transcriptional regulator YafY